jgi:hypothetical protein
LKKYFKRRSEKILSSFFGYINLSKEEEKKKSIGFVKSIFPSEVLIYGYKRIVEAAHD